MLRLLSLGILVLSSLSLRLLHQHSSSTCAILLSGGVGKRMHSPTPKQYLPLHKNKSAVFYSLAPLLKHSSIQSIVIVHDSAYHDLIQDVLATSLVPSSKDVYFAPNGPSRIESVMNGLEEIERRELKCDSVLVHDAARPLLHSRDLGRLMEAFRGSMGGAILARRISSSVKRKEKQRGDLDSVSREGLWEVYTPQVFLRELYRVARRELERRELDLAGKEAIGDDEEFLRLFAGFQGTVVVESEFLNLKITTPGDLAVVESLLSLYEDE